MCTYINIHVHTHTYLEHYSTYTYIHILEHATPHTQTWNTPPNIPAYICTYRLLLSSSQEVLSQHSADTVPWSQLSTPCCRVWGARAVMVPEKSEKRPGRSWCLRMCPCGAHPGPLHWHEQDLQASKERVMLTTPRREFVPWPPGSLGQEGLMSPSTKGTAVSHSSWISLAIALFVLQLHSKRNK